jgi:uncharacterized membrane protein (DUF2068 family)
MTPAARDPTIGNREITNIMSQQPSSQGAEGAVAQKNDRVLGLIAALKLLEGSLILGMAFGVLKLLHHDVAADVTDWITALRIDPHNEYIHRMLTTLGVLDDHRLKQISAGSFVYAALRLTEGFGLLLRKRWAEYFTAIATGLLIPLEIHELFVHASLPKAAVFVVNVAVVWYLIVRLRRNRGEAAAR